MTSDASSEPHVAVNPYEVLGLLPSAPQELVVEVYWHSVGQIRSNGVQDADSRDALELLNDAYAFLSRGDGSLQISEPQAIAEERKRGLIQRFMRRQPKRPTVAVDHWRSLTVAPSASTDVVDLAYAFWVRRTHGKLGSNAGSAVSALHDAYEAIRTNVELKGNDESQPPNVSTEADASTAVPPAPQVSAPTDSPTESKSRDDQKTRKIRAALGRLVRRVGAAAWSLLQKWAADPLLEYDPNKPKEARPRPKPASEPRPVDITKLPPVIPSRPESRAAPPIAKSTPARPAETEASPPKRLLNGPCLVAEDGRRLPIVSEVLTIGTDLECDVVAELRPPDTGVVAAHIWAEDDRVVLHVLAERPKILVNGVAAVWAFLEDGDELKIDGTGYQFQE